MYKIKCSSHLASKNYNHKTCDCLTDNSKVKLTLGGQSLYIAGHRLCYSILPIVHSAVCVGPRPQGPRPQQIPIFSWTRILYRPFCILLDFHLGLWLNFPVIRYPTLALQQPVSHHFVGQLLTRGARTEQPLKQSQLSITECLCYQPINQYMLRVHNSLGWIERYPDASILVPYRLHSFRNSERVAIYQLESGSYWFGQHVWSSLTLLVILPVFVNWRMLYTW